MDFNIESRFTQKFIAEKRLPQNSQNSQKFIVEKKLPQISRIYTDVSKMFCVFREFCGSLIKAAWEKFIAEKKTPTEFTEYTEVYC